MLCRRRVWAGFAVKQYLRDIKKFGYRHKVVRFDQEPAIQDLLGKVADLRPSETVLEATPVGDSRANGRA